MLLPVSYTVTVYHTVSVYLVRKPTTGSTLSENEATVGMCATGAPVLETQPSNSMLVIFFVGFWDSIRCECPTPWLASEGK